MKKITLILLILFTLFLSGCGFAGYKPDGDIYLKSQKKIKKQEITEVLDLEIQEKEIDISKNSQMYLLIGLGHKYDHEDQVYCKITVKFIDDTYNVVYLKESTFEDYYTDKYATYKEKTIFKFLNKYPDFYPDYHEQIIVDLQQHLTTGKLIVEMVVSSNTSDSIIQSLSLEVAYKFDGSSLKFSKIK